MAIWAPYSEKYKLHVIEQFKARFILILAIAHGEFCPSDIGLFVNALRKAQIGSEYLLIVTRNLTILVQSYSNPQKET